MMPYPLQTERGFTVMLLLLSVKLLCYATVPVGLCGQTRITSVRRISLWPLLKYWPTICNLYRKHLHHKVQITRCVRIMHEEYKTTEALEHVSHDFALKDNKPTITNTGLLCIFLDLSSTEFVHSNPSWSMNTEASLSCSSLSIY